MKRRRLIQLVLALALAVGVEPLLLGSASQHTLWWTHVPGFFALFGFFVCLALVFLSNALGKYWLQRDERYYQRERPGDE